MELSELENIWKECDRKMAYNNRINRDILRKILLNKPEKTISWMKIRSILALLSPLVFFVWLGFTNFQFHTTIRFYIGIGLFLPVYLVTYVGEIRYYFKIRDIDLSGPTLNIKKKIAALEKVQIKLTKIRYMLMPIAALGVFLIFFHRFNMNMDFFSFIFLLFAVLILSAYYRFKYSIRERFRVLNKEIEEINQIENE